MKLHNYFRSSASFRVRIALEHRARGWARFSPLQMRVAAAKQVEGALAGLNELMEARATP